MQVSSMVRRAGAVATAITVAFVAGCGTGTESAAPTWQSGVSSAPAPALTESPAASPTASASPSPSPSASKSASPSPSESAKKGSGKYVFPVGGSPVSYHPTHSAYPATDIFADCGNPVLAVTDGKILEVSRKDEFVKKTADGSKNGGLAVSVLGDDGVRYYGSHLSVISAGIEAGVRVRAGQKLGAVGKTGNANNVCHLHFGISPACGKTGDWWIRRGVVWPASFLDSWRKKTNKSPVSKVREFSADKGCPDKP